MQRLKPKLAPTSTPKKTPFRPDRPNRFKTQICWDWNSGNCRRGAKCTFAHGKEELLPKSTNQPKNPPLPCKSFQTGFCSNGRNCRFSHEAKTSVGVKEEGLWELSNEPAITPDARNKVFALRKEVVLNKSNSSSSLDWPDPSDPSSTEEPKASAPIPECIRKSFDTFSSFTSVAQRNESFFSRFNVSDNHTPTRAIEGTRRELNVPITPVKEAKTVKSEVETPVATPIKSVSLDAIRKGFASYPRSPLSSKVVDSPFSRFNDPPSVSSNKPVTITREGSEMRAPVSKSNGGTFAPEAVVAAQNEGAVYARVLARMRLFNTAANVSLEDLKDLLDEHGGFVDVVFVNEPENSIADAYFCDVSCAEAAIRQFEGMSVDGRPLTVQLFRSIKLDVEASEIKNQVPTFPAPFTEAGTPSLIRRVYGEESMTDCVLLFQSELYYVHKSVLASASSFFRQMFKESAKQERCFGLSIPGERTALKDILDIVYHHQCIIEQPNDTGIVGLNSYINRAMGILRLAEFLGIRVVQRYFCGHLHRWTCAKSSCNLCSSFTFVDKVALLELQKSQYAEGTPMVDKIKNLFAMLRIDE